MFLGCFFYCFLKKISFIEVELIYSVVLISVLLFPILLERPECPTRRPGCRLWVPCWPCPAAPEAGFLARFTPGGLERAASLVAWVEGWRRGGCSAHSRRPAQRFLCWTESRERVGWANPAGPVGPRWALGGPLCVTGVTA